MSEKEKPGENLIKPISEELVDVDKYRLSFVDENRIEPEHVPELVISEGLGEKERRVQAFIKELAERYHRERAQRREEKMVLINALMDKDAAYGALRKKLAGKDEANAVLHKKLADKDEEEVALRREAEALRKKAEAAEKALHEKGQQLESVKWTLREVFGISATPPRSSDAPTPSRDAVPPSEQGVFERSPGGASSYPGGQYSTPMVPGFPRTLPEKIQEEKEWQDAKDRARIFREGRWD